MWSAFDTSELYEMSVQNDVDKRGISTLLAQAASMKVVFDNARPNAGGELRSCVFLFPEARLHSLGKESNCIFSTKYGSTLYFGTLANYFVTTRWFHVKKR